MIPQPNNHGSSYHAGHEQHRAEDRVGHGVFMASLEEPLHPVSGNKCHCQSPAAVDKTRDRLCSSSFIQRQKKIKRSSFSRDNSCAVIFISTSGKLITFQRRSTRCLTGSAGRTVKDADKYPRPSIGGLHFLTHRRPIRAPRAPPLTPPPPDRGHNRL